jgi:hypothetical protein
MESFMDYRYTRHQVARGSRPDAETHDKLFLIKRVSEMRATYQVRLLTYLASQTGRKLIIELPKGAKLHRSLRALRKECPSILKIVRT